MSVTDLQIHSDIDARGPSLSFELDEKPKREVYIGRDNPKRFYIAVSGALLALSCIFLAAVLISTVPLVTYNSKIDRSRNKAMGSYWNKVLGENYRKVTHPYFIVMAVTSLLVLVSVAIFPTLGRKRVRYISCFLLFSGLLWTSWVFCSNNSMNFEPFSGNIVQVCWLYLIFFNASLGTFFSALTSNRKPKWQVGVAISWVLAVAEIVFLWVFARVSSPVPHVIIFRLFLQGLVSLYLVTDLEYMFTQRYDFYLTSDWFLGMVHLITDWTFRFWYNVFVKRKRTVIRRASKMENVPSSARQAPPEVEIVEATTPKISSHSVNTAADELDGHGN